MSGAVASRVARSISEQDSPHSVAVVWHGGEPLTTPMPHFQNLLTPFDGLRQAGAIRHHVQTNATLISPQWCDLIQAHNIQVGVSVDGPASANLRRVDLAGNSTHDRFSRGVALLRERGIDFHVICVVTPETVADAQALVEYFATLGCTSVGFNIEEQEGVPTGRSLVTFDEATGFWRTLLSSPSEAGLKVRELDQLAVYLAGQRQPDLLEPIPTVAYNGDVVLLSPELAGVKAPDYGDFRAGNVLATSLPTMIRNSSGLRYVAEYAEGLRTCEAQCAFWDYCRGAQAGNRYFEHGSFAATETNFCRTTRQALITAAADLVRDRATSVAALPHRFA